MNREQFETLVWELIEGSIDEPGRARLQDYARQHPEALEWQREQEAFARRLACVREVAPPEVLRARIDEALGRATPPHARPVPALVRLRGWFAANFSGWSPVLRTETRNDGDWDPRGHGRYQAMSLKRNGVIFAFSAVIVVAIVAIGYLSLHRPPAPAENATGATGAAQRYKAEQIKEQDVRLDLQGEEALDDAIFAVLTDDQKVDMLDRMDAGRRQRFFGAINVDEAKWAGMDRRKREALLGALNTDGVKAYCAAADISPADFERRKVDQRVDMLDRMDAGRRQKFFGAMNLDDAKYATMDRRKKADVFGRLDADGRKAFRASVQFTEADFQAMPVDQRADILDRMDAGRRQRFFGAINVDEAKYAAMDRRKKADLIGQMDVAERSNLFGQMTFERIALGRMDTAQQAAVWERMNDGARKAQLGRLGVDETQFGKMNVQEKAALIGRLDAERRATGDGRGKGRD